MPVFDLSYDPPFWLCNGHLQTLWPVLFRRVTLLPDRRERLETPDGDFVDVDFFSAQRDAQCRCGTDDRPRRNVAPATDGRPPLAILSHGLEGSSRRSYMLGMARELTRQGWDVAARNFRGCSGEPNRLVTLYHSGETADLDLVVRHCETLGYRRIALVGFSMGGNQTLKYLGEDPERVPAAVQAAAVLSVPCDLAGSAEVLARLSRAPYMAYFLDSLRRKIEVKHTRFPDCIDITNLARITTFDDFDNRYTAPLHGFASARHYWQESSCLRVLDRLRVPSLLVNAADDPFLSPSCTPLRLAQSHRALYLEIPRHGGHVGFVRPGHDATWAEQRVASFLGEVFSLPAAPRRDL